MGKNGVFFIAVSPVSAIREALKKHLLNDRRNNPEPQVTESLLIKESRHSHTHTGQGGAGEANPHTPGYGGGETSSPNCSDEAINQEQGVP